jgi:DNA-binding NarL/FixJ family response regulator
MSPPIRVILADDHYLVREGTRQLLELGGEVTVVAAAADAAELLAAVQRQPADVVVTDIRMPPGHHMEGIEAAHAIRADHPDVGVVVLSNHADDAYAIELFRDGTAGLAYLLKDRVGDRDELLGAVRATAAGGSVIDPVIVESLVRRQTRRDSSRLEELTDRERSVLEQMAIGRTNGSIAEALHLSVSAVEKNINSIFTKLGLAEEAHVHRRVAAVLAFLAHR